MIKPLGETVLLEPVVESDKTESGRLYLPQNVTRHEEFSEGIVRAFRIVFHQANPEIKLGARVLYPTHSGHTITSPEGTVFRIVPEKDLLAVVS